MEALAETVQEDQKPDRRALRAAALQRAQELAASDGSAKPEDLKEVLSEMVVAFSPTARASAGPRELLDKAEPAEVGAYFGSTGLTRKELAAAAGVSTSVIATVQNPKGDRWSVKTFEAKKVMIAKWSKEHRKEIETRQKAEAAEAQARADAEAAKVKARADREAAAAAKAAAAKAAPAKAQPVSLASAKAGAASAKKPGRPSKAARQANRKVAAG